jgi:hypothetical protein
MIDIHPPEHGIHGTRDFFLHLFTITIGLLIALSLEASVEAVHHRHQRKEAEATIRQEIVDNRAKLVKMQTNTRTEIDNLSHALTFVEDLRSGKKDDPSGIKLDFKVEPLQSAGWSTASATGALSYMSYNEVQNFATAYHEQQNYEDAVARALGHSEVLDTYLSDSTDPRSMKPQDIETAIPDLRLTLADLAAMSDWGRGALGNYDDALKH